MSSAGSNMEYYGSTVHFGDYKLNELKDLPNVQKYVRIEGAKARQLADLALHQHDLEQVKQCLTELNATGSDFVRAALWQLAIITFIKCFTGSSARIQLDANKIFGSTDGAMEAFRYFKNLRDKHFVHDENAYSQCVPALAINDGSKHYNIEKVVALASTGITLDQGSFGNLELATNDALRWVTVRFDQLCNAITSEMEQIPREKLLALPDVQVEISPASKIAERRESVKHSTADRGPRS